MASPSLRIGSLRLGNNAPLAVAPAPVEVAAAEVDAEPLEALATDEGLIAAVESGTAVTDDNIESLTASPSTP